MQTLIAGCRDLQYQGSMWHLLLLPRCYCLLVKARRGCITGSGGMSQQCIQSTCGLAAMTSAPHAEGRQFDPGQVYVDLYSLWGSTATVCQVVEACQSAASATRERKMSSKLSGAPALLKFHARLADGSEPPQIHICAQAAPNDVMFGQAVPLSGLFSA